MKHTQRPVTAGVNREAGMTKEAFLAFCGAELGTEPDYPFDEDFETAVLRHKGSRKWFAVVMKVSRRKFGIDSDEAVDIVNLKIPLEMFGFFDCTFLTVSSRRNMISPFADQYTYLLYQLKRNQ